MPARKSPSTLEAAALKRIGLLFRSTCCNVTEAVISALSLQPVTYTENKTLKDVMVGDAVNQLQLCFFVGTAHYFHSFIVTECLVALSDLCSPDVKLTAFSSPVPNENTTTVRQNLQYLREQIHLDFLDILCNPALKEVNVGREALGPRRKLHWSVVARLCDRLPHISSIETLNLGHWSCKKFSLLADHNQLDGWPLQCLPNLRHLCVSDVSQRFFQSIGTYCPNLIRLQVFSSDITDSATWWVAKCTKLQMVELFEDRDVTPVGYAQLLRANSDLKSLGRCDCFGQVLYLLYDVNSMYRRSYSTLPEHLKLEEIDTNGALSVKELCHLVRRCPSLKKIRFKYQPVNDHGGSSGGPLNMSIDQEDSDENEPEDNDNESNTHSRSVSRQGSKEPSHLAELCALNDISQLSITGADFYGHLLFQLLEVRGDQLAHLELVKVDEANLNLILLIGANCHNLTKLCLHGCHFQMQPEDPLTVDKLCNMDSDKSNVEGGAVKRIRLTSTSSLANLVSPFQKLDSLEVYFSSPAHLPILQYVLHHSGQLKRLLFDQFYSDYEESLVTRTLFSWSPLEELRELMIGHGAQLSVVAVNVVLANCRQLKRLGRLDRWGRVTRQQITSIRAEIKARNFDLLLDTGPQDGNETD